MKKIIFLLAFLFATITNAQTPARHYGGVILGSFASDPTGVMEGQIYWNTTDNKFRAYDGTIWSDLVGGASLQSVLDTGDTWTSGSGFSTLTLGTSSAGSLVFRNTDENWGYNINSEQWSFTDALGNNSGMTYITTTEIAIGNGTNRANLNSNNITTDRDFEFPDASGQLALTSDIANVSEWAESTGTRSGGDLLVTLGDYDDSDIGTKLIIDNTNDYVKIESGNGFFSQQGFNIGTNPLSTFGSLQTNTLTSNRVYDFPDASGTIALTSDIQTVSLQNALDNGDTWTSSDTFENFSIETDQENGKISYTNSNEGWGYYLNAEEGLFFTDGTGALAGRSALNTSGIYVGNGTYVADVNSSNLTADRTFQFPNATGTLALTSDIPSSTDTSEWAIYTGTRVGGNLIVTLGDYDSNGNGTKLTINDEDEEIVGTKAIIGQGGIIAQGGNGIISNSNLGVRINNLANNGASILKSTNIGTTDRTFEFQDASGTIALTSDIPNNTDYVDLTTAQTISGDKTFSGTNDVTGAWRIFDNDNFDVSGNGAISQTMKKDTDASGTQLMVYDRITYDGTPSGSTQGKYNYYRYQGQSQSTNAWHNVNYYRVEDDEDNNTSVLPNSSLQNYNLMYQRSSGTGQNISGEFGNNINRQYWDSGYGGGYMDEAYNVFNILSYDNSDWTTGEWWSNTNKVEATAGTITNLKGVSQTINLSGTVNNSNLYGYYFDYTNTSSGTQPTNAFAFYNDSSLPILSDGDIEISNNRKLLIEDTGGDFTDYDTSLAVAPVWESGHSDAIKIGKWNKLLVEQNASSTQYWNYNDVRLNGNTNGNRYDMNWTGSYYNGTGGFSEGTTHSLNQMLIKNTTSGTRDFGFVYNQNNIITVDDDDGGTVTTTVEDYMTLFNQSNISDDNITINDHWLNLNQLNYDDGSIGELYGLNIDFNISGSADVTNTNHLLNLEYTNTSSGSVVSPYAIYSASDIPSFHRGDIEIGSGSNITIANGDITTGNGDVFVASGKVHTGGSGGSATIEQDDLKLVKGISGSPTVQGTSGAITHTISFDATGGSNTTLSTPNGYVGQIAVAHEKTPQIETGSSGGTTNSTNGKDFYYLKWTGGNGNETFNLPSATTNQYRTLQFITNSTVTANTTWTLDGSGSQTIDGSTTYVINRAYEGIKLWSDGTEWIIIQAKK